MLFTLVYDAYFEWKPEILVFGNILIDSKERVFWVNPQGTKCQTSMLCTNVQTTDRKGLSFSKF